MGEEVEGNCTYPKAKHQSPEGAARIERALSSQLKARSWLITRWKRQYTSMALRNTGTVARRAREKGCGWANASSGAGVPSPGCLWWSRALLEFKGSRIPPLAVWHLMAGPSKGDSRQQGSSAALCTDLCATTARQPRSGALPDGGSALAEPDVPSLAGPRQQNEAPRNTQAWNRTVLSPYLIYKNAKCLKTIQGSDRTPSSC